MLVCLSCNPRFQRRADHLHGLGSRAVGEFPAELAQRHSIEHETAARSDEWRRRLTPEMVAAPGGLSPGVPSVPAIWAGGRRREREGKKLWRPIISVQKNAKTSATVLAAEAVWGAATTATPPRVSASMK